MTQPPVAWLIREMRGPKRDQLRVMAGKVFLSEETANAAAARLTNRWRLCMAFPVFESYRGRQVAETFGRRGA
jgi:hypothetical protein